MMGWLQHQLDAVPDYQWEQLAMELHFVFVH